MLGLLFAATVSQGPLSEAQSAMDPENLVPASVTPAVGCSTAEIIFADMHDGDSKKVIIKSDIMTIAPYGNNETWLVNVAWDTSSCSGTVDFSVPGKPGPPPVSLKASYLEGSGGVGGYAKLPMMIFTDPSGTIAKPSKPLNTWVADASQNELMK